jgi:hypothetical protein
MFATGERRVPGSHGLVGKACTKCRDGHTLSLHNGFLEQSKQITLPSFELLPYLLRENIFITLAFNSLLTSCTLLPVSLQWQYVERGAGWYLQYVERGAGCYFFSSGRPWGWLLLFLQR